MIFMATFFYTYTGILGENIAAIDILSFFISVILGESISNILVVNKFKCNNTIAILVLTLLTTIFIAFTYNAPNIGIFKDPITGKYGITKISR